MENFEETTEKFALFAFQFIYKIVMFGNVARYNINIVSRTKLRKTF